MKKIIAFVFLLVIVLTACSTNRVNMTNSDSSVSPWTLEDFLQNMPFAFEGTALSSKPYPSNKNDALIEVRVDKVYQGSIKENTTVLIRTSIPDLFPVGEMRFVFAEPVSSVFDGLEYYRANTVIYPIKDKVNASSIVGLENFSYSDIIERVEKYVDSHPYNKEVIIEGKFCDSDDLKEIYDFSSEVLEVIPREVLIDEVPDRTAYNCEVVSLIKGESIDIATVLVQKNAMNLNENYILLLTRPSPDSDVYIISAQHSVIPAQSDEARFIRSLAE